MHGMFVPTYIQDKKKLWHPGDVSNGIENSGLNIEYVRCMSKQQHANILSRFADFFTTFDLCMYMF